MLQNLSQLQNYFQDYLHQGKNNIQQYIVDTQKVSAESRLTIYSDAYRLRLLEALTDTYPTMLKYLGESSFTELATAYIDAHPSTYKSIRWFGDSLANFLSQGAQYQPLPFLIELAQLEWTLTLVFDAADSPIFNLQDMANIPMESWENMVLKTHPSVHLLNFSWNVVEYWRSIETKTELPEPVHNSFPIAWVLWRKELQSQSCALTQDEGWVINALLNNLTFGECCEGLCQWVDPEAAPVRAAALLKTLILNELISDIRF